MRRDIKEKFYLVIDFFIKNLINRQLQFTTKPIISNIYFLRSFFWQDKWWINLSQAFFICLHFTDWKEMGFETLNQNLDGAIPKSSQCIQFNYKLWYINCLELSNFISNLLYQQKLKSVACEIFQLNLKYHS